MEVPRKISSLIIQFKKYENKNISPSTLKTKFIKPFFRTLGWEFSSDKKNTYSFPEVINLSKISSDSPDYLFKANNNCKFYVSVFENHTTQNDSTSAINKLHKFCWNANLPIGVLTNFKRLNVYNCCNKPGTKIKTYLTLELDDYIANWAKIEKILSKSALSSGNLIKNATAKSLINSNSVYISLAKELIHWHKKIFDQIKNNFSELSIPDVHLTANRFLNRILFLRFCEKNGLETADTLKSLIEKNDIYQLLTDIFQKAEEKYNTDIFHFHEQTRHENKSPDKISLSITLPDKLIKDIINKLYSEKSIYEFSAIPIEIIARAYDIYLSHLPDNLHSPINEYTYNKSEDMRSEFNTINYIVDKTLGEHLQGKKPGKRALNALRILDMSCGSGIYLLACYQYLLDWHLKQYIGLLRKGKDSSSTKVPIFKDKNGIYQLTFSEKCRILLNNIYGVDINRLAVEATIYILLLASIENYTNIIEGDQLDLFKKIVLPDLTRNVKCGNALIESDLYKLHHFDQSNKQKKLQINSFDWQKEFPSILSMGGFDIILGKPPVDFLDDFSNRTKPYIKQHFVCFNGFTTLYILFYEKAIKLLKNNGLLGYVVPDNWLSIPSNQIILKDTWIKQIVRLKSSAKSTNLSESFITIIKKQSAGETYLFVVEDFDFENPQKAHTYKHMHFMHINSFFGFFTQYSKSDTVEKIRSLSKPLISFAKTYSGYNPYELGKGIAPEGTPHTAETLVQRPYHSQKKTNENWKTEIIGRDISRYCLKFIGMRWVKYGEWLAAPRNPEIFKGIRILIHERISTQNGRIEASLCQDEVYHGRDVLTIKPVVDFPSLYYLLGIINSKLFNWYYLVCNSDDSIDFFPKLYVSTLNDTPIFPLKEKHSKDKNTNQEMISFVKRILELNQKKLEVRTKRDILTIDQMIENIDRQIDDVVYSIYGLNNDEIQVIEDSIA